MTRLQHLTALRDKVKAGECQNSWNAIERAAEWSAVGLENTGKAVCAYNGSLDAAKALHEALLPKGEGWEIYRTGKYPGMIPGSSPYKYAASVGYGTKHQASDDNPARAWLLAILEALIAQEGGE